MVSIDNHHNSYPEALKRVCEIARDELPDDASEQDRESAEVDAFTADLTRGEEVRGVYERLSQTRDVGEQSCEVGAGGREPGRHI